MNEPVWNCGCFRWMHGTEDACDLYLPERKPARGECPFIVRRHADLTRALAEIRAQQATIPGTFIPVYGLRNDQRMGDALGMMNAAGDAGRARELANITASAHLQSLYIQAMNAPPSLWDRLLGGAAGAAATLLLGKKS